MGRIMEFQNQLVAWICVLYVCTAPDAPNSVNGLFIGSCPCSEGFECQKADGTPATGSEAGKCVAISSPRQCNTVQDCQKGECCIDPNRPRGRKKRSAVGECRKLGTNGDACFVNINTVGDRNFACPCAGGFQCQGNGIFDMPLGETGTCVATPRRCNTVRDCQKGECCIDPNRPIGRKKREAAMAPGRADFGGECRKLGMSGDACFVNINTVGDKNFACPCAGGFQCQGNGIFDIPLGETGTCSSYNPCTTNSDCSQGQCCLSRTPLKGRKKRQVTTADAPGTCQPFGASGSNCYVIPFVSNGLTHGTCPCGSPLQCQGSGVVEVPLGESGTCV